MPETSSRAPYSHRFHAGNVGDVWKHLALVAVLRRFVDRSEPVRYLDTHSGEGRYKLGPQGEWSEGIGRIWSAGDELQGVEREELTDDLRGYWAAMRAPSPRTPRPTSIPGSPALAQHLLRETDSLELWEVDTDAAAVLARRIGDDPRVAIHCGDGPAALASAAQSSEREGFAPFALVDPPWSDRAEWNIVPTAVIDAVRSAPSLSVALWYPIKSLTRPNAMLNRFRQAGIAATTAELVTTPLELKRKRLSGSGVLLIQPPPGAVTALAAAAPALGRVCSTEGTQWSLRVVGW